MEDVMRFLSKWFVLSTVILLFVFAQQRSFAFEGDTLYVKGSFEWPGGKLETPEQPVQIMLRNVTPIKGLQFTLINVPKWLTIADTTTDVKLTDRSIATNQTLSQNFRRVTKKSVTGDTLTFLIIPKSNATVDLISEGNSAILNLWMSVKATATGGSQTSISLINVALATYADNQNKPVTHGLKSGYFWIGKKGDVVFNKKIDLFDVLRMIDIALGRPPEPTAYERWAGDFNNSGSIDIQDVYDTATAAVQPQAAASAHDDGAGKSSGSIRFRVMPIPVNTTGRVEIPVTVRASEPVAGVQMSFKLPSENYTIQPPVLDDKFAGLEMYFKTNEDELTLVLFDAAGENIPAGENTIFSIPVDIQSPLKSNEYLQISSAMAAANAGSRLEAYTSQEQQSELIVPESFALHQNSPNPFNMSTFITYDIPRTEREEVNVTLRIYNMQGQLVRTLENQKRTAGRYTVHWDGRDDIGQVVSSGVYFYQLDANDVVLSKKMAVMK